MTAAAICVIHRCGSGDGIVALASTGLCLLMLHQYAWLAGRSKPHRAY
jgi:hypothetical protein